jgi:cell division GTPase FtsZ
VESKQEEVADALEKRIQALEAGAQYEATRAAVQKVEQEFLIKLREMRAAIVAEQGGATASGAAAKELEALRAENVALKKRTEKLEYRVSHMLSSMETLYEAKSTLDGSRTEI